MLTLKLANYFNTLS